MRWQHASKACLTSTTGNEEHFVDLDLPMLASQSGPSLAPLREGTSLEVHGCDFYAFRNGKVIRKDSY